MKHQVYWTAEKAAQRLGLIGPLVYRRFHPLPPFQAAELDGMEANATQGTSWTEIRPPTHWGKPLTNYALRGSFQVPEDWPTNAPVALYLPIGDLGEFVHPEALVSIDGRPFAACDRFHQEILLPDPLRDGKVHRLDLLAWIGGYQAEPQTPYMKPCGVVQIDAPTRELVVLARNMLDTAQALSADSPARSALVNALDEAFLALNTLEPVGGESFYASVQAAVSTLKHGLERAGAPENVFVTAVGHAHIDLAWLWPLSQTRRKGQRTFYNVLRLMEQFPEYIFAQSQPQLYEFVRQDDPELFIEIRERVREGRWEVLGGMWVEADCNLSGSESLARQFVLGRTFFREQFGKDAESPVLWLPDVFGYAWNLPQLIRQAGLEYFFTIKISWNQYNQMPYHTFWWQGLDGTRVLTHFSPSSEAGSAYGGTYNAVIDAPTLLNTWRDYRQKELGPAPVLMSYGWGDGGGGPTAEMLENRRVLESFPGLPQIRPGRVGDFFRRLEKEAGSDLPVWNGELYLEYHRGTYTTQSRSKRANRKSEFLLHDAELLCTWAALLDPGFAAAAPWADLSEAWHLVCLNQFHDILPGSSIGQVYVDSMKQYERVRALGEGARSTALAALGRCCGGDLLVVNPTGFQRSDLAFWPGEIPLGMHLEDERGRAVPVQKMPEGSCLALPECPPCSAAPLRIVRGEAAGAKNGLSASPTHLENEHLRVELDAAGDICRIYDKVEQREVLVTGGLGNQFRAYEDRPVAPWDAWDIDIFYQDRTWLAEPARSIRVLADGPLYACLEVRRRILNSTYVQRIALRWNSPRLDFETTIDWRERHTLLKAAFPVEVLAPTATFEIQWGSVQRPTHYNTSWDWARFETCAQKWVDLSEGGYGVSLLNDCKYGHSIRDQVIQLSLLRGTTSPDPEADQGEHRFAYSLLVHSGPLGEDTLAEAYALNDPLLVWAGEHPESKLTPLAPLLRLDPSNLVIETVKQAEDGEGWVVRLYESQRKRGTAALACGVDVRGAARVNLLEEEGTPLEVEGNTVRFGYRPFEIVTIKIW